MNASQKKILAIVGMPGAGKSEVIRYLKKKGIPSVRFGEITDNALQAQGLPLTQEHEKVFREQLRKELGMAAYAIKARPKIDVLLEKYTSVAIDGLYSWEEYVFLNDTFAGLKLIHIFAEPSVRYRRLSKRAVRPLSTKDGRMRDVAELEGLNKGGPIAIADYMIDNSGTLVELYAKLSILLSRLDRA